MIQDILTLFGYLSTKSLVEVMLILGVIFILFGTAQLLQHNQMLRTKAMKTIIGTGVVMIFASIYLSFSPRMEAESIDKPSGKRQYVEFNPSRVTIADGWVQISMKNDIYINGGKNPCKSSNVVIVDNHRYALPYLELAQQALLNGKKLSVGMSGNCVTRHSWNEMQTLILLSE